MEISILDKSNYLRGLLIVAKKDNQLAEQEKKIIRHCAEKLGFARDFYEDTLKDLLANTYISEEPIIFSDKNIAESFITEGLNLAHSDNSIVGAEIEYMSSTRKCNALKELVELEHGTIQKLPPDNARRAGQNSSSLCASGIS